MKPTTDHPDPHPESSLRHPGGLRGLLSALFTPHAHAPAALDPALADERGMRALLLSLAGLMLTALFQVFVVLASGSTALLADTLHNFSDALTAIPLWLAFRLARRPRNPTYTYGYGRAEDLAGVVIVVMIFLSAGVIFYEAIQKIASRAAVHNLGWVAAAALIGFAGNELVALYRIRTGQQIGSAALVADGLHARSDGITSLGVLAGAIGVWLGFPWADPVAGLLIGLAILWIGVTAAREIWLRLMDAADPALSRLIETTARSIDGVQGVHDITLRWLGHRQRSELHIVVDRSLPTHASHAIAEQVRHALFHSLPALSEVTIHIDPSPSSDEGEHANSAHHR